LDLPKGTTAYKVMKRNETWVTGIQCTGIQAQYSEGRELGFISGYSNQNKKVMKENNFTVDGKLAVFQNTVYLR
jgi:hypothetical protein